MFDMGLDVGLGLVDRRTVVVIVFTMVLATTLTGNHQLPLDTNNAVNFFVDLVLLVGYFYCTRSIYRFPVALVMSFAELWDSDIIWPRKQLHELEINPHKIRFAGLKKFSLTMILFLTTPLFLLFLLPLMVFSFGNWVEDWADARKFTSQITDDRFWPSLVLTAGVLDRFGVVMIAVFATVPVLRPVITGLGTIGIILLVVIFTIRGNFTALVKDILQIEAEEQQKVPEVRVRNYPLDVRIVKDSN
jgi:hypothetical protein